MVAKYKSNSESLWRTRKSLLQNISIKMCGCELQRVTMWLEYNLAWQSSLISQWRLQSSRNCNNTLKKWPFWLTMWWKLDHEKLQGSVPKHLGPVGAAHVWKQQNTLENFSPCCGDTGDLIKPFIFKSSLLQGLQVLIMDPKQIYG